jgi:SPOR domain
MKKIVTLIIGLTSLLASNAQLVKTDSSTQGTVQIKKDYRLNILEEKQRVFNKTTTTSSLGPRAAKGYRLMVVSSSDREYVMKVRSQLLSRFPEQEVYMEYQSPYIKLKYGNFVEKGEADRYKSMIKKGGIVTTNIYVLSEIVKVKPDKNKENEEDNK